MRPIIRIQTDSVAETLESYMATGPADIPLALSLEGIQELVEELGDLDEATKYLVQQVEIHARPLIMEMKKAGSKTTMGYMMPSKWDQEQQQVWLGGVLPLMEEQWGGRGTPIRTIEEYLAEEAAV